MKVTSKLALSQLKLNRKRTIGTISSISLSTALITAVMCFATSGNKMLTDFLGPGYGDYAGAYSLIIAVPALILALLISIMSVTVISNIFTASANKRIQEFGILKCVGGTSKQIKESVIFEGLWLSIISIPSGLILGTVIGYIGVGITGHYVYNFNELAQSIIMRPFSFSLSFSISVWTYVFASVFSMLVVLRSANKPAKTVGKITAIECIKGLGANKKLKNTKVNSGLIEKIFGSEGDWGYKNIKRNLAGYKASIRALSLGIILLMLTSSLASQAKGIKEWMNPDSDEVDVSYCSIRDINYIETTGRYDERIVSPITAATYNEITTRLSEISSSRVYGVGEDSCTYTGIIDSEFFTPDMKNAPDLFDENQELKVTLISVDDTYYKELCDRVGASYGSNLLINHYKYNDNGTMKDLVPWDTSIDEITLVNSSAEKSSISVDGFIYLEDLTEKGINSFVTNPIRLIVPGISARAFDWFSLPIEEKLYIDKAKALLNEYYPILTEDSYVEQGYTVRVARMDTMSNMLNISIVLAEIVMYGLVILLIVMGFTSVVSTLATNIKIRKREFAVLKSIGMTSGSLKKMIYCESLFCVIKSSFSGILFGIAIPFAINLSLRIMFPVLYHIPWITLIVGILGILALVFFITYIEIDKIKNTSIIEEIRMDAM